MVSEDDGQMIDWPALTPHGSECPGTGVWGLSAVTEGRSHETRILGGGGEG